MHPELLNTWSYIALIVGGILVVAGTCGSFYSNSLLTKKQLEKDVRQEQQILTAEENLNMHKEKISSLEGDLEDGKTQLEDAKEQRETLAKENTKLKKDLIKAQRGISDVYLFNGLRKISKSPGSFTTQNGNETTIFFKFQQLQQENKFIEIIELANRTIKETPSWLTPYLFRGQALANLQKKNEAINDLRYVIENSGGDPEYNDKAEATLNALGEP